MKLRDKLEYTQRKLDSVVQQRDQLHERMKQADDKAESLTAMLLAEKAELVARLRRVNVLLRATGYRDRSSSSPESYR